jgi:hypothetical protein
MACLLRSRYHGWKQTHIKRRCDLDPHSRHSGRERKRSASSVAPARAGEPKGLTWVSPVCDHAPSVLTPRGPLVGAHSERAGLARGRPEGSITSPGSETSRVTTRGSWAGQSCTQSAPRPIRSFLDHAPAATQVGPTVFSVGAAQRRR